jgi:hypothetical protein
MSIKYLKPAGLDLNDEVYEIRVRVIWLCHGFWAALGSAISGITGNPLTHWWVEIKTKTGKWYCAQFNHDARLTLTREYDQYYVTQRGKRAACRHYEKNINVSEKYTCRPSNKTMRNIVKFMESYDGNYRLITNNCQHFGKGLYDNCSL